MAPATVPSPSISVIIPHYADLENLDRCLQSLATQTKRPSCEIIVGDNNSPVGASAVAETIASRASLVTETERGAGPARNAAVSVASGEILAFIDADCIADPNWLENGIAALKKWDIVGGKVNVTGPCGQELSGAEAFEKVFAFDNENYVTTKGFTITGNLFCARRTFDQVGLFANGVSEDMEWCHRARDMGLKIGYCEDAIIGHAARKDWNELKKKWKRLNREGYELLRQKRFGTLLWLVRTAALPLSIFAHLPRAVTSAALSARRDRLAAAYMLVKLRLWRFGDGLQLLFRKDV